MPFHETLTAKSVSTCLHTPELARFACLAPTPSGAQHLSGGLGNPIAPGLFRVGPVQSSACPGSRTRQHSLEPCGIEGLEGISGVEIFGSKSTGSGAFHRVLIRGLCVRPSDGGIRRIGSSRACNLYQPLGATLPSPQAEQRQRSDASPDDEAQGSTMKACTPKLTQALTASPPQAPHPKPQPCELFVRDALWASSCEDQLQLLLELWKAWGLTLSEVTGFRFDVHS